MSDNLIDTATTIRKNIIDLANQSKSPHVGSCLSCADILTALYFKAMRLDPWDLRDIFILSKAHAAMALYATLACRGIMKPSLLNGYYKNNGTLPAHLNRCTEMGIEVSAGSLGHGFNMGIGIAHGFQKMCSPRRVYALIGDGESQEGSVWEGAMFASKLGLRNFTAIMDNNDLQGYGRPSEVCCFEPMRDKWAAFGWFVVEVDGHDVDALRQALQCETGGKPRMIIAKTIKGKGVSFMEDQLIWHYYIVTDDHKKKCYEELTCAMHS
jgi:transketolase